MLITFHADESFRKEKIHSWMGELVTICNSYTEVEIDSSYHTIKAMIGLIVVPFTMFDRVPCPSHTSPHPPLQRFSRLRYFQSFVLSANHT